MSHKTLFSYCPQSLYGQGCTDSACPLKHDAKYCKICASIFEPASIFHKHVQSEAHLKKAARQLPWIHCTICDISISAGDEIWSIHIAGRSHRSRAARQGVDPVMVAPTAPPQDSNQVRRCEYCDIHLSPHAWNSHVNGRRHLVVQQHAAFRATIERATQDRGGVVISHGAGAGLDFGIVSLAAASNGVLAELSIQTEGSSSVTMVSASVHSLSRPKSGKGGIPFTALRVDRTATEIRPGQTLTVPVQLKSDCRGRYEGQLAITFQGKSGGPFVIVRRLLCVVGDANDHETLKPVTPYIRRRRAPWNNHLPTVSGERPPSILAAVWVKKLPRSRIPVKLAELLKSGTPEESATRVRERYFQGSLTLKSHQLFFANLLWVEESRMLDDLRRYDMVDVNFTQEGRLYTLEVPGLAEKRPSVMIGDTINVQGSDGSEGRTHEGFVHEVRLETIRVSFHGSFQALGRKYNVRFQYNRVPLRRQHQALHVQPPAPHRLLFPLPGHESLERPLGPNDSPISVFNALIEANHAQLQAVKSVLHLRSGSAPFVIFGPPGTGKTVTIVEAIRQVLHRDPQAKVLACAPSNSASDIIALRLTELSSEMMFRCNAASRDPASVPAALLPYSLHMTNHYAIPPLERLKSYRVIVSTCGNSSFAYNVGMARGHFTHIFVDEAGQATEPEVLTAIKTMVSENTRVVLSGDPKQLGPIVRSSIAREHGLGTSYMERLMDRPVYAEQRARGRAWIKLLQNYRSHKTILHYPNEKFYDGELEVCGQPATINSFIGSPQLVSPEFPVVFHAISGNNDRESSSPSYFNIDEASEVKAYVQSLLADRRFPIQARDIGVITPYHAQVRKIRKLLRDAGAADVHVGSVEEFQGQERRAIIISTVRSSTELLAYDAKFTLGFVSNPRRFNVALTRAQALLIVVGDAAVLCLDPVWRAFMNYVHLRGGWRGDPPAWDVSAPVRDDGDYAEEMQEAANADMSALLAQLGGSDDWEGEANVDRPFGEPDV